MYVEFINVASDILVGQQWLIEICIVIYLPYLCKKLPYIYFLFQFSFAVIMLPEGEDLLQRLSGELGIPEFLDDLPMLEEAELPDANSFYETLMNDTGSVFEPMPHEPDFTINFNGFPPSPSNSDTSSGSSNSIISALDVKDGILSPVQSHSPTTFSQEISPPVSPPAYPMQTNLQANNGASIVSVSDLTNVKIPIPKIQKPSKCLQCIV